MCMPNDIMNFILAINELNVEKFAELAKNGEDLNWTNPDDGNTLFLISLKNFGERISGIPLDKKSSEEQIAELEDIAKKAMSIISIFLESGANVNCEDIDGCTPLGCVKYYLYLGMLSFLPSAMDGKVGEKKDVMQMISRIFEDITLILVKAGADENRKNKFNETPSEYANRFMMDGIKKRL